MIPAEIAGLYGMAHSARSGPILWPLLKTDNRRPPECAEAPGRRLGSGRSIVRLDLCDFCPLER